MERKIDVPNSSRTLIDILRSTLSLVGYYGDVSGLDATLRGLKSSLVQTIAELEKVSENGSSDSISSALKPPHRATIGSLPVSKHGRTYTNPRLKAIYGPLTLCRQSNISRTPITHPPGDQVDTPDLSDLPALLQLAR